MPRRTAVLLSSTLLVLLAACGGTTGRAGSPAAGVRSVRTELGRILVDGSGRTLYTNVTDVDGHSTCVDDCAMAWRPVPTAARPAAPWPSARFGTVVRPDHVPQLGIDGRPLYTFSGDLGPGSLDGQGRDDEWFVVDPAGVPVDGHVTAPALAGRE